jgi:uncharacterized protein YjbI with pentapeptide repeats
MLASDSLFASLLNRRNHLDLAFCKFPGNDNLRRIRSGSRKPDTAIDAVLDLVSKNWPNPTTIEDLEKLAAARKSILKTVKELEDSHLIRKVGFSYLPSDSVLANRRKIRRCEKCGTIHEVNGYYHSGFSALFFLYCNRDVTVLTIDEHDPEIWRILEENQAGVLTDTCERLVEGQIVKCPCGGEFNFQNPLRCPACGNLLEGPMSERVNFTVLGDMISSSKANVWSKWHSDLQDRWNVDSERRKLEAALKLIHDGRSEEIVSVVGMVDHRMDMRGIKLDSSMTAGLDNAVAPNPMSPWIRRRFVCVEKAGFDGAAFDYSEFREVLFKDCRFADTSFRNSKFIATRNQTNVFENVDFENSLFTDEAWDTHSLGCSAKGNVTTYRDCNFSGSTMYMGSAIHPSFENCIIENVHMGFVDFLGVSFVDCRVSGLVSYVDFKSLDPLPDGIEKRDYGAHCSNLADLDLSHCELDDISFSTAFHVGGIKFPTASECIFIWHPLKTLTQMHDELGKEFSGDDFEKHQNFIEMEIGKEKRRQGSDGLLRVLNWRKVSSQGAKYRGKDFPKLLRHIESVSKDFK